MASETSEMAVKPLEMASEEEEWDEIGGEAFLETLELMHNQTVKNLNHPGPPPVGTGTVDVKQSFGDKVVEEEKGHFPLVVANIPHVELSVPVQQMQLMINRDGNKADTTRTSRNGQLKCDRFDSHGKSASGLKANGDEYGSEVAMGIDEMELEQDVVGTEKTE